MAEKQQSEPPASKCKFIKNKIAKLTD